MVTGRRLEIWLANPAGWDEILRLSEDQGKLCWGQGVNWSVTLLPIWMTPRTNENHCSPLPHSPALHKSLFGGHWLKKASGQLVHTNILVTFWHKMVAGFYLLPVGLTDMHISSFLPRLWKHIIFSTTFIFSIRDCGHIEVSLLHTNCAMLTSENERDIYARYRLFFTVSVAIKSVIQDRLPNTSDPASSVENWCRSKHGRNVIVWGQKVYVVI